MDLCEQALKLQREVSDRHGIADTLDSLGYAHHHLGHYSRAVSYFAKALNGYRAIASLYGEAETLARLGDTHHTFGQPANAEAAWRDALAIFDHLSRNETKEIRAKLAGLKGRPTCTQAVPAGGLGVDGG